MVFMIYMLLFLLNILLRNGSKICQKIRERPRKPARQLSRTSEAGLTGRGAWPREDVPQRLSKPARRPKPLTGQCLLWLLAPR